MLYLLVLGALLLPSRRLRPVQTLSSGLSMFQFATVPADIRSAHRHTFHKDVLFAGILLLHQHTHHKGLASAEQLVRGTSHRFHISQGISGFVAVV